MKIFKIYCLFIAVLMTSCQSDDKNREQILVKRKVFLIDHIEEEKKKVIESDTSYLEYIFKNCGLIDIKTLDSSIKVNLKYADTCNFLKRDFYDGLKKAYFPCEVGLKICGAQYYLKQINPNYSLLILDASRPLHVQQMMWDSLKMPPDTKFNYLSPPYSISLHNYGCAVDVTIIDLSTAKELDMGSQFDHFGKLSEPVYEWQFLKSGELTQQAFENRKLLRSVMQAAKLNAITSEWWHFNYCSKELAAQKFILIK